MRSVEKHAAKLVEQAIGARHGYVPAIGARLSRSRLAKIVRESVTDLTPGERWPAHPDEVLIACQDVRSSRLGEFGSVDGCQRLPLRRPGLTGPDARLDYCRVQPIERDVVCDQPRIDQACPECALERRLALGDLGRRHGPVSAGRD